MLLDCFVYAPLGAAIAVAEEVPKLAERGRESADQQLAIAKLIGRFVVAEGRRRFGAASDRSVGKRGASAGTGSMPARQPAGGQAGPPRSPESAPRSGIAGSGELTTSAAPGRELPIPAYDTLAASQVVERLASLTPAELEAVRRHESATRRRRTVLHRIAQLNSERDGATA